MQPHAKHKTLKQCAKCPHHNQPWESFFTSFTWAEGAIMSQIRLFLAFFNCTDFLFKKTKQNQETEVPPAKRS